MIEIASTANIVSAVYLLIIIIGIHYIDTAESENTKIFSYCCRICFVGLIIDSVACLAQERMYNETVLCTVNYMSYVWFDVLLIAYGIYLITLIDKKIGAFSEKVLWIVLFLCTIDFVLMSIGTITGKLFTVKDAKIVNGPWNEHTFLIPSICLLIYIIYLLRNSEILGVKDLVTLSSHFILQLINAVMWAFGITVISGYVGFALSLTIIFVMIQFGIIAETRVREEVFNELSTRDVLTGLRNRRAYENCLAAVSSNVTVYAAFCDVNSLKEVNDTLGHEAGDALIRKMADILREVFADEEIFRISGDEFVVVIQNEKEQTASEKMNSLKQSLQDNDRISAVGFAAGKGRDVLRVINSAEQRMYLDKQNYYKETGKSRERWNAAEISI